MRAIYPTHKELEFDTLVSGHLTRLGTKADVQVKLDFFADILAGAELGLDTVTFDAVTAGIGISDPENPNFGNTWCDYLECTRGAKATGQLW